MNKSKLLQDVASNLRALADNIQSLADAATYGQTEGETMPHISNPESPAVTIEQIRAVLAEKSQTGLTDKVRALLNEFGAARLSEIEPDKYPALMQAAKELK